MSQKRLNILFRISGGRAFNKELGLGHVYRSMNLASQLKHHSIHFLVEDYGKVIPLLIKHGYQNVTVLKKEIDLKSDIEETVRIINKKKIDILIVDKYDLKTKSYVKAVRKITKTIVVSDLKKIDYDADLVVNGFIGFKDQIIKNRYRTKCLLGPRYQILHKKYEKKNHLGRRKYTILATFGGFDEHNIVELLCEQLSGHLNKITAKIILGPATIKSDKIKYLESKYSDHLQILSETNDLKKEISTAEFGICGGGITTYEFAAMGIPFAIICQYKHQLKTARAWQKRNIALNLGFPDNNIKNNIQRLLKNIVGGTIEIKPSRKPIVDGLGARRVANEILNLVD